MPIFCREWKFINKLPYWPLFKRPFLTGLSLTGPMDKTETTSPMDKKFSNGYQFIIFKIIKFGDENFKIRR